MRRAETARKAFEAFTANDFESFFGLSSERIRLYPRAEEPGVKDCYEGWDEMLDYLVNWYSGWDDYTVEAERFIDAGDWVVVDVREIGIAARSGMRVEENFAHAVRVEDGKVTEWRMFGPLDEALETVQRLQAQA